MNNICVVFICNKPYFNKFIHTCNKLINKGKYTGDICLVIGDDLQNSELLEHDIIKTNNIRIKYFPDIKFTEEFLNVFNNIKTDGRNLTKKFQWHKLHLFNTYFKQWKYIFYIDCGMKILSDISPILNEATENTLLAHSDAYPTYEWKLHRQFDKTQETFFKQLNETYNLNIDYFQTGIMLYDTNIIEHDSYDNLYNLALKYPISRTNEQGIVALYFTNIKPLFKQIKTHNEYTIFYDSIRRKPAKKYIMFKMK